MDCESGMREYVIGDGDWWYCNGIFVGVEMINNTCWCGCMGLNGWVGKIGGLS